MTLQNLNGYIAFWNQTLQMVSDTINKTVSIFPALKKGGKKSRGSPINDYTSIIAATTELFCDPTRTFKIAIYC